jgi:hypothetical protein
LCLTEFSVTHIVRACVTLGFCNSTKPCIIKCALDIEVLIPDFILSKNICRNYTKILFSPLIRETCANKENIFTSKLVMS